MKKIIVVIVLLLAGAQFMVHAGENSSTKLLPSASENGIHDNTNNRKFESVTVMNKGSFKKSMNMYWKFFFEKGEKVPKSPLPQQILQPAELFADSKQTLKASWLGHSSMLINIDGYSILTDPLFERKVSIVGPSRFNTKLPLKVEDLVSVDVVIISHDHYDHLNKYSVKRLIEKTSVFVVPLRVGERLLKWGVPQEKIVELNWWDECNPLGDLIIAATPSQHFSGRGLTDRNSTLWASWVIKTPNHNVFFSGDTGYFEGFKDIGEKYGPFDVTFLECGAYNESWSNIHMFPEQTVQAYIDLKGKILQPIHWATFNLALHAWYEPIDRLISEAWIKNVHLSVPVIGQVVDYEKPLTVELWWAPLRDENMESVKSEVAGVYR